jgi:hypothetical protein
MPTKIIHTEPALDTPTLFTTTDISSPGKILPKARATKLKMSTKKASKIIEPPSLAETAQPVMRLLEYRKNATANLRKNSQKKKIFDLTGLTCSKIRWKPFYRGLSQEEFKVVCKNYSMSYSVHCSRDKSVACYACAIHPNCTHVLKRYE